MEPYYINQSLYQNNNEVQVRDPTGTAESLVIDHDGGSVSRLTYPSDTSVYRQGGGFSLRLKQFEDADGGDRVMSSNN